MFFNYLKLSFRLLIRNPFFTFINVLGLSIGFAVFFILWQYSQNELKSDQFHSDWERIVRLNFDVNDDVFHERMAVIHPAFSRQLAEKLPELSEHTLLGFQNEFNRSFTGDHGKEISFTYINSQNQKIAFKEQKLVYADRNLFEFFNIQLIAGDKRTVLNEPNAIVLSEKLASKYFGHSPPIGSVLLLNDSISLIVTGIYKNLPGNSSFDFEGVMSISRIEKNINEIDMRVQAWFTCYFKLPESVDREALIAKIEAVKVDLLTKPFEQVNLSAANLKAALQPLHEIAYERIRGDDFIVKSKPLLTVFGVIAIVVLMMAWINFINMTIAASTKRIKELAARLGVGARPHQFIVQFIVESVVVNVISLFVAVTLIQLLKNPAHVLLNFPFPEWKETSTLSLWMTGVFLLSGICCSGIYPAVITLKRTPISLFGSSSIRKGNTSLSYGMTIAQFSIAVVLIIWAFAVFEQINFILNRNLGFRRDHVVIIDLPYLATSSFTSDLSGFLKRIESVAGVDHYTVSSSVAGDNEPIGVVFRKTEESTIFGAASDGGVDDRFLNFYGIKLLAGRNFLPDHPGDKNAIIVSKKVLKRLHIKTPEEAVGVKLLILTPPTQEPAKIIGVVEDYNRMPLIAGFQSYWNDDLGVGLTYGNHLQPMQRPKKVSLQIRTDDFDVTLKHISALYGASFHGTLFNWYFLDQHVNHHYQGEKIIRNQILVFTGLAIGIACLGLLGMVSYKVVEKTKEIGIRKVLGAQLHQIAKILLSVTIRQIVIAILIGVPTAYYLMQRYLEKFSDRIVLHWWHFAIPVGLLLFIMFITIVSVLFKAARTNPVESLRYE